MKYVILFDDDPEAPPDLRQTHMQAHLAFLERNADAIEAAGPLHAGDGNGAGGIWLLDVASESDADRLVREDPFWPTGLRKSWRILKWTQVFAGGERLI